MISYLIAFVVVTLISSCCLWGGMKLTKVEGTFGAMLAVAAVSSLVSFIPLAGWLISIVAMFVLICMLTDAEFWPDAILMVFVAKLLSIGIESFLVSLAAAS